MVPCLWSESGVWRHPEERAAVPHTPFYLIRCALYSTLSRKITKEEGPPAIYGFNRRSVCAYISNSLCRKTDSTQCRILNRQLQRRHSPCSVCRETGFHMPPAKQHFLLAGKERKKRQPTKVAVMMDWRLRVTCVTRNINKPIDLCACVFSKQIVLLPTVTRICSFMRKQKT